MCHFISNKWTDRSQAYTSGVPEWVYPIWHIPDLVHRLVEWFQTVVPVLIHLIIQFIISGMYLRIKLECVAHALGENQSPFY